MKYVILAFFIASCGNMTIPSPGSCSVVKASGVATISCTDGTTATVSDGQVGAQGSAGLNGTSIVGPQGPIGLTGAVGMPGNSGSIITSVQFCPNPTVYPTTFSEVALCIDDNLYAVYSQNSGFLVYLPPGAYTSNGINSSCNFTVASHCVVQ